MKRFFWVMITCISLAACSNYKNIEDVKQTDFSKVATAKGVTLYRNGEDFIQIVKISEGASLHLILGPQTQSGEVIYFGRGNIREWFHKWSSKNPQGFSAINAEFFDETNPSIAQLAFSVKENSTVYKGYGDKSEYPAKKMLLIFDANHYDTEQYNDLSKDLQNRQQNNGIVGLRIDAPKSPDRAVGRTYIGIRKGNEVVIFSSPSSTREYATKALQIFGVENDNMMMLDGGPSAQLVFGNTLLVSSNPKPVRIPAIIVIEAGHDSPR